MAQNLELYKVFLSIVESGSFSGASRELFISQPAVSQAVRQLEEALQVKLFIRGAKGATLTPEGHLLHDYVSAGMNLMLTGEKKLHAQRSLLNGELHIGAGDTITKRYLLPYLGIFHEQYPGVSLKVHNRTSTELVGLLKEGDFDIAFANLPIEDDELTIFPCMQVHDIFVAGPGFEHLLARPVGAQELAQQPLIMLEPKSNSRRYVDREFKKRGIELAPEIELGAFDLLMDFAKIGLGIACVIHEFAQEELLEGRVRAVDLHPPIAPRQIGICHLSAIEPSPAAKRFMEICLQDAAIHGPE